MINLNIRKSEVLPGALSSEEMVLPRNSVKGIKEYKMDYKVFMNSIKRDAEHDILIGSDGAIAGLYIFDPEEADEKSMDVSFGLANENKGYNISVKEEEIPVVVGEGPEDYSVVYSTHVFYIANYKDFLTKEKDEHKVRKIGSIKQ